MVRLVIAVIAALGLHILLLMTVLPERLVVGPEVIGSGHVTVSIVRRHAPVPDVIEEPVAEQEQVEQQEERVAQEQNVKPVSLPHLASSPEKFEPVKETIVPVKKVAEGTEEIKAVRTTIPAEPAPEKVTSSALEEISVTEVAADSSVAESLRQPEPLATVNRPPAYPLLARKRGWQGTVLLEVDVRSDGMVENIEIKESSSYELLDREALNVVRKWRFSPGLKAGQPVPMKVVVPIHFLLQDN